MPFQNLIYLKLDRSKENIFCYSHIFIIFEALILYLEHKGRLILAKLAKIDFDDIVAREARENCYWNACISCSCCTCGRSQITWVLLPHKDYKRGEREDGRYGVWFSISFIDLCVLPLLPIHSSNNHFGSIFHHLVIMISVVSLHLGS